MKILDKLKNIFLYSNKYKTNSEAVIIACYFNPQNNPYRLSAFLTFYESIKHLNHRIIECVIGDAEAQLPETSSISRIHTPNLLWHKESLLNKIISDLPQEFKYVFWLDTDVIFTNNKWLVEGVESLQTNNILQPFEYCVHLDQNQTEPSFKIIHEYKYASDPKKRHPKLWRSFSANHNESVELSCDVNYDKHGHVGFAWGARREILDEVPLYDKALIGGADHIIAHASAGQIGHSCILKSFTDDIDAVNDWSRKFYAVAKGKIGYVKGDLYHIWHGALEKRQYLKRIQDFTSTAKNINERDENGLHVCDGDDEYVKQYFDHREDVRDIREKRTSKIIDPRVKQQQERIKMLSPATASKIVNGKRFNQREANEYFRYQHPESDDSFIESLIIGYMSDSAAVGTAMGGNVLGAMIGDALNSDTQTDEFSGGEFGGAGSGGTWEPNSENDYSDNDYDTSENFS